LSDSDSKKIESKAKPFQFRVSPDSLQNVKEVKKKRYFFFKKKQMLFA
jgi:hypothetical protein